MSRVSCRCCMLLHWQGPPEHFYSLALGLTSLRISSRTPSLRPSSIRISCQERDRDIPGPGRTLTMRNASVCSPSSGVGRLGSVLWSINEINRRGCHRDLDVSGCSSKVSCAAPMRQCLQAACVLPASLAFNESGDSTKDPAASACGSAAT